MIEGEVGARIGSISRGNQSDIVGCRNARRDGMTAVLRQADVWRVCSDFMSSYWTSVLSIAMAVVGTLPP